MKRFPSAGGQGRTRALAATLVGGACILMSACLRRPVSRVDPTTKLVVETVVSQPAIEKIDLLVMVDSSVSMADKQRILARAVPDLLEGLVRPKCVEPRTRVPTGTLADPTQPDASMCPVGSEPAFLPITDMHIGVLSSSLGGMGGSECGTSAGDDHGHLLARGSTRPGDFLAWYPPATRNEDKARHPEPPVPAIATLDVLEAAFRERIVGVGQLGCGLEAQLESVYRFLVQPDPWTSIARSGNVATYAAGTDDELLKQRAAFLRPDSLVAVIVLTDEDDSSADPLAFGGQGWRFMDRAPLPRPTAACASEPASPRCVSCSVDETAEGCSPLMYSDAKDDLNVRFHDMKRRYGVDPQFPIQRYVDAFSQFRVPRRDEEHDASGRYAPKVGCTNPLFAARLPTSSSEELCDLERGPRSASLVYLAVIGGLPGRLLPEGQDVTIDWTPILGRDPGVWDETGIDAHMLQSSAPRVGLPSPSADAAADPVHGREWTTGDRDLQFACTFPLFDRNDAGEVEAVRRTCDADSRLCDCNGTSDAPLCAPDDRKIQVLGKAYPSRRPLLLAKNMGDQGIVASLCPKQLTHPEADDYGYRPAVRAITARLERSLVGSCLPRALTRTDGDSGEVACLVLAMLPEDGPDAACDRFGLEPPPTALLAQARDRLREGEGEASMRRPICVIPQFTIAKGEVCKDASDAIGFCYTEAPAITRCAHALTFTKKSQELTGARFTMQCVQEEDRR